MINSDMSLILVHLYLVYTVTVDLLTFVIIKYDMS